MANQIFVYLLMFSMVFHTYNAYNLADDLQNTYEDEADYDDEDWDDEEYEGSDYIIPEKDKKDFYALEAKEKFQKHIPFSARDFYNCNSNKLYHIEDEILYQYNLDSTGEKRIDLTVDTIYYVDDNWFYYLTGKKICRVPVKNNGKG